MYFFEIIHHFEIIQHDVVVSGYCDDLETATQEVANYISQYKEDEPIDVITIKRL